MTDSTLLALARTVAHERVVLRDAKADYADALREFERQHAEARGQIADATDYLQQSEESLRGALLAAGHGKHVAGEVKQYEALAYDAGLALSWARTTGLCLTLDKKAFEQVAKVTPLPFVTTTHELRAALASDMDKAVVALEAANA